jgi:hypothetical protein
MVRRRRDLYSFPKPKINLQHVANLRKYRDIIANLHGVLFFTDPLGNRAFFYFSESLTTIFEYGQNHDHGKVEVYRKLRLPSELELALEKRCIEFS